MSSCFIRGRWGAAAVCAVLFWASEAAAQRTGENPLASADDAFGTTVGNESVGLYGAYNTRGFSPTQAGNVRIEGLYFDQQGQLNNRDSSGSTIHVGLSAQSYAFPAPTGIADYHLRLPGDTQITSAVLGYGAYDTYTLEVDSQVPLIANRLSIGFGIGAARYGNDIATPSYDLQGGVLMRWQPNETLEVMAFWGQESATDLKQQPQIYPAGANLPPYFLRRKFFGQDWSGGIDNDTNMGVITREQFDDGWAVRTGVFRSLDWQPKAFDDILGAVAPDGASDHQFVDLPPSRSSSYSGEIRVSKFFVDGDWRHSFHLALRGRDVERTYGDGDTVDEGLGIAGVRTIIPEPAFDTGPLSHDHAQQGTAGLSYEGLLPDVVDFTAGVQKTDYHRNIEQPGEPPASAVSTPWLYNATLNFHLSKAFVVYGGLTRGLEESGTAPSNAFNRGQAMPASITQQYDAGVRYSFSPKLSLVAGVFQVEKPYFNLSTSNVFGPLGTIRNRGAEISLTGTIAPGLTVVSGLVLLQPRVSGDAVTRGLVGPVPVGPMPRNGFVTLQYQVPQIEGLSVDGQVSNGSAVVGNSLDTFKAPGWTELQAGLHYSFRAFHTPMTLRALVANITDEYAWNVNSSGNFFPRSPRRFSATLAMDF